MATTGSRVYPALPPGAATEVDGAAVADATGLPGEVAPARAMQTAGVDGLGLLRVPRVDGIGSLATVPDRLRNGVYLHLPRVLTSQVVSVGNVTYFLDPNKWSKVLTGSGTVEFDSTFGEAKLSVTSSGDEAIMAFNNAIIYSSGHGIQFRMAHRCDNPTATGMLREWGGFTEVGSAITTGFFIGFYIEDGVFGIFFRFAGGATTRIPQSEFNIDRLDGTGPSGITMTAADLVHATIYSAFLDWFSTFYVGSDPVTSFDFGSPSTSTIATPVGNPPVLRLGYRVLSTGAAGSSWTHIAYGDAVGSVTGASEDYSQEDIAPVTIQSSDTVPVVSIRAAATLGGVTMGKRIVPKKIAIIATGPGRVFLYYGTSDDIVLSGASFATPTHAPGSGAEIDVAATDATIQSTARSVSGRSLIANVEKDIPLTEIFGLEGLTLTVRGDGSLVMLTVLVRNDGAGPITATVTVMEWKEIV